MELKTFLSTLLVPGGFTVSCTEAKGTWTCKIRYLNHSLWMLTVNQNIMGHHFVNEERDGVTTEYCFVDEASLFQFVRKYMVLSKLRGALPSADHVTFMNLVNEPVTDYKTEMFVGGGFTWLVSYTHRTINWKVNVSCGTDNYRIQVMVAGRERYFEIVSTMPQLLRRVRELLTLAGTERSITR